MNNKQVKRIKKNFNIKFPSKVKYAKIPHEKVIYIKTPNGLKATSVTKFTFLNTEKITYKKLKKSFMLKNKNQKKPKVFKGNTYE